MFKSVLFTCSKTREETKHPSTTKKMNKQIVEHPYTQNTPHQKKRKPPIYTTTQISNNIMLSERS